MASHMQRSCNHHPDVSLESCFLFIYLFPAPSACACPSLEPAVGQYRRLAVLFIYFHSDADERKIDVRENWRNPLELAGSRRRPHHTLLNRRVSYVVCVCTLERARLDRCHIFFLSCHFSDRDSGVLPFVGRNGTAGVLFVRLRSAQVASPVPLGASY